MGVLIYVQETFFKPQTNGGYLANRLRTENRIFEEQKHSTPQKQRTVTLVTKTKHVEKTEELQRKLEYMKDFNLNRKVIRESMLLETFSYRNEDRNNISVTELFPRFLDS
ncbi:hypothetical protein JTB14_014189 [Gonioctena quinquepunctata]|nr:hypothetical protein JTB14_014189 [Gonioctena quinquepunctata]